MITIMAFWIAFGVAFVVQLFTAGAKAIDGLPPFWFWGVPLAPYSALYTPWARAIGNNGGGQAEPPAEPTPPPTPESTP